MAARILIVEDHQTMREAIRLVLEPEGFEVLEATDGHAAIAAVRRDLPDLVVLDLGIPGVPGEEVLRTLKEDAATSAVPVIVVTATGEEARERVVRLGADAYFTKPFGPLALLAAVARALGGGDSLGS